jgi:arsenate reductase (thioredoxin)
MIKNVLFVCIHNSARSQMAEAFLNQLCPQFYQAKSAGIEPGKLNQIVVAAMKEVGIDISQNQCTSVAEMIDSGAHFDVVITVCDDASAERCPFIPEASERLHWSFPDPSSLIGSDDEKLIETRKIRDEIYTKIKSWCDQTFY